MLASTACSLSLCLPCSLCPLTSSLFQMMTLIVLWTTATVTTAVRRATASRRPTTPRPSPTPRSTNILCARRPWVPGSPTATPCTAMRSSPSHGPSGSHCGVEGVCVCVCVCLCVCVCVCVSVCVCVCPTLSPGVERGIGGWRELEASGLRKQHPCFLVGSRNFLYPKSYQENSASLIKRGLLWLKEEKEVTKPLRVSPAKWGLLGTPAKALWSLCTL